MALQAHLAPMISLPKTTVEEVDWTGPIRSAILHSYGEDPDIYATECANLHRCRQDAVKGAGSGMISTSALTLTNNPTANVVTGADDPRAHLPLPARDLLYKYFGQLELLELRFPEIRVSFPWRDAFTSKLTTQTSSAAL